MGRSLPGRLTPVSGLRRFWHAKLLLYLAVLLARHGHALVVVPCLETDTLSALDLALSAPWRRYGALRLCRCVSCSKWQLATFWWAFNWFLWRLWRVSVALLWLNTRQSQQMVTQLRSGALPSCSCCLPFLSARSWPWPKAFGVLSRQSRLL